MRVSKSHYDFVSTLIRTHLDAVRQSNGNGYGTSVALLLCLAECAADKFQDATPQRAGQRFDRVRFLRDCGFTEDGEPLPQTRV